MFHSHYCQESMFWLVMIRSGYCIIFLGRLSLPTSHALYRNSSNDPAESAARGARCTRDFGIDLQVCAPDIGCGNRGIQCLVEKATDYISSSESIYVLDLHERMLSESIRSERHVVSLRFSQRNQLERSPPTFIILNSASQWVIHLHKASLKAEHTLARSGTKDLAS